MQMRIVRETPGQNPMYGVGEVRWQHDSQHYRLELNAGLDLLLTSVTLYQSVSEGQITRPRCSRAYSAKNGAAAVKPRRTSTVVARR
jgi:hypothetical protein